MPTILDRSPVSRRTVLSALAAVPALCALSETQAQVADPLPSWNDGRAKQSILDFVSAVIWEGSPEFIPLVDRIATFDNDGTLWVEQPMYTQLAFALDRVKALAPLHPEWSSQQPFKAALERNMTALVKSGEHGMLDLIMASHAGMTTDEFEASVKDWLATARHPRFERHYTELVYQPMLELIAYLRANQFQVFLVSGGGVEFMRPWTKDAYGVARNQVIGSSIKTQFEMRDGRPMLFRLPAVNFIDDKAGKPVGINAHIGARPVAAFGNSDGDLEMLQWTTLAGNQRRLGLIVHHDDAEREYAYDRHATFGRLDTALDAAALNQWTVVSMRNDWRQIFPSTIGRALR